MLTSITPVVRYSIRIYSSTALGASMDLKLSMGLATMVSTKSFLPAAAPDWSDIPMWDKNTIARASGTPDRWGMNDQAKALAERTEYLLTKGDEFESDIESPNGADNVGYKERTVYSKLSEFISPEDFGAVGDGASDDTVAVQAAFDDAADKGRAVRFNGRFYGVSAPVTAPAGVSVSAGHGGLSVLPGFSGNAAFRVTRPSTGNNAAAYYRARRIKDLIIRCNAVAGVVGIMISVAERDRIMNPEVHECATDGIIVSGGYGAHILNATVSAASVRRGSVANVAPWSAGIRIDATDCVVSVADISFFPVGVRCLKGHNHFKSVHPWSSYWANDPAMLVGFWNSGEGNVFSSCNSDSPSLIDTSLAASIANGGYGFYNDGDSINTRISDCTVQTSANGDRFPGSSLLVAVHVGKVRNSITGIELRDYGGFGFAANPIRAVDSATLYETTISGGNISQFMSQNVFFANCDSSFQPSVAVSGSSVGITYSARNGWKKTISGRTDFKLSVTLSNLGGLSGSVAITGLPVPNQTGGIPAYFLAVFIGASGVTTGRALLAASSQSLLLQKMDGSAVNAADLGNTAQIIISGVIMTTYGT